MVCLDFRQCYHGEIVVEEHPMGILASAKHFKQTKYIIQKKHALSCVKDNRSCVTLLQFKLTLVKLI